MDSLGLRTGERRPRAALWWISTRTELRGDEAALPHCQSHWRRSAGCMLNLRVPRQTPWFQFADKPPSLTKPKSCTRMPSSRCRMPWATSARLPALSSRPRTNTPTATTSASRARKVSPLARSSSAGDPRPTPRGRRHRRTPFLRVPAANRLPLEAAVRRPEGAPSDNLRLWDNGPIHLGNPHSSLLQPLDSPRSPRRLPLPLANHHNSPRHSASRRSRPQGSESLHLASHLSRVPQVLLLASPRNSVRSLAPLVLPPLASLHSLMLKDLPLVNLRNPVLKDLPLVSLHNQVPKDPPLVSPASSGKSRTLLPPLLTRPPLPLRQQGMAVAAFQVHSASRRRIKQTRVPVPLHLLPMTKANRSLIPLDSHRNLLPQQLPTPLLLETQGQRSLPTAPLASSQRNRQAHLDQTSSNHSSSNNLMARLLSSPTRVTPLPKMLQTTPAPLASKPTMPPKRQPNHRQPPPLRAIRTRLIAPGSIRPSRATAPRAWTAT